MSAPTNSFCWNGIVTTDPDKTLAFFPEVLGWQAQEVDMDGDKMHMFAVNGKPVAHLRKPQMEGEPSWWNNYLRVEDVDASVAAVKSNGGKVLVPGTDITPGRFATVQSPSGATFTLFRESDPDDAGAAEGAVHWVDLHSKGLDADVAFLKKAFGFETEVMPMPNGAYHLLKHGGAQHGGAMTGMNPEAPSMWLAWAKVDDADAALGRAKNNGGKVLAEAWDVPGVGRMGIAADPAGVVFGVIKPA